MRAMFRLTTKPTRALALLLMSVVLIIVYFSITHSHGPPVPNQAEQFAGELDQRLQSVAAAALGEREGAIVVLDPQTGRLRAVVNPKLALQQASPPGSTIKPFTALAALRNNTIEADTRMRCGEHKRKDVVDSCSHPPNLAPFDLAEALAYSCNYYFATVGEQLDERSVASLFSEFGFGQPTGVDDAEEP